MIKKIIIFIKSIYWWIRKQQKKICFHRWVRVRTGFDDKNRTYESDHMCEKCENWKTTKGKF